MIDKPSVNREPKYKLSDFPFPGEIREYILELNELHGRNLINEDKEVKASIQRVFNRIYSAFLRMTFARDKAIEMDRLDDKKLTQILRSDDVSETDAKLIAFILACRSIATEENIKLDPPVYNPSKK